MARELSNISFYLAKENLSFEDVINDGKLPEQGTYFQSREFDIDEVNLRFFCQQKTVTQDDVPVWLDFINQKLDSDKINFTSKNTRPSGLLLLQIENTVLAACFGTSSKSWLEMDNFYQDFGIITAMNMCGNENVRQTKSRTHALNTQHIDRQISKPSGAYELRMNEAEILQYVSANLSGDNKVSLQGKNNLTIKIIGEEKLSWDKLIAYGKKFIAGYASEIYKDLFPNYPNLKDVSKEKMGELDEILVDAIRAQRFDKIHLAIPEFIADDEFGFTYSNHQTKENILYGHIDIEHLKEILNIDKLVISGLKNRKIYAYSSVEEKVLGYKFWKLYNCVVAEVQLGGDYFILSNGFWKKVDDDFAAKINDFIENILVEETISDQYKNIYIYDQKWEQNREAIFNKRYCALNANAIKFDGAKLKISLGNKNNEFCDILEYNQHQQEMNIIHVKRHGGSSSLNHLFSQARYYSEFFLNDDVFLEEIREHILESKHPNKIGFLNYIKEDRSEVNGRDYNLKLWILYNKSKGKPDKMGLPLMAKYELKLTYELLRNDRKYKSVTICMIPVTQTNFTKRVKAAA
ncbi:MAG: TIGR04141 family sporadically distributed protein [Rhizobiales bacterium]|nr:TIGR04141 family sporadically distributed protein [Hyphomicrobiales bacterium]NRB14111.1 TIGR04141 family sporadically distributed protein [Hyphomicrobiales bacterium]